MNKVKTGPSEKFLSTREAAARLGVALSTIQTWVETGVLPAWKTAGGHRRIPADAVDAIRLRKQAVLTEAPTPEVFKVLVVEDDAVLRELYRRQFTEWNLPIRLLMAEDGFEGLMLIGRHNPDLIIADLSMPGLDGFKMIRKIKSQSTPIRGVIIVVTALTAAEIAAQGGLPADIPVYPKPVPFAALRPLVEHMARRLVTS